VAVGVRERIHGGDEIEIMVDVDLLAVGHKRACALATQRLVDRGGVLGEPGQAELAQVLNLVEQTPRAVLFYFVFF
jgi:hypothetical protein